MVLDCYIQCVMGEGIRCLKSLAVWDTTHKYERVVVGVLCVHYSGLSLFLPICFLFEPVVDCTTHRGHASEVYAYVRAASPQMVFCSTVWWFVEYKNIHD